MTQVSVCIATFRRNDRLRALLEDLRGQRRRPDQVVIVDNEPSGAARPVVEDFRVGNLPFEITYEVQPIPNISQTRNRTVDLARGEWLAFIDDDERAPEDWLQNLLRAAEQYAADGVLSPVEPQVPESAPSWIRRGRFYDFPHQPEGATIPLNRMRFGNVLLRAERVRAQPGPFDVRLGLMTGEDVDLLARLVRAGARIVWTERAPVYEPIEDKRLSLRWLLLRSMSGGQAFARYTLAGGFGPMGFAASCRFIAMALAQMLVSFGMALVSLPFGRHRAVLWLIKASANMGKLSAVTGWRYEAYARDEESGVGAAPCG